MLPRLLRIRLAVVSAALLTGFALAQATWTVDSLIPDLISVRVPTTTIVFGLDDATYPPDVFPARYSASLPEAGMLPVQVFSNAEGLWNLILTVPDLWADDGGSMIPAQQVLFRVNGGPWLRGNANPQVVFTQRGPTVGWEEIRIDFALELVGTELSGAYRLDAQLTASHQAPF